MTLDEFEKLPHFRILPCSHSVLGVIRNGVAMRVGHSLLVSSDSGVAAILTSSGGDSPLGTVTILDSGECDELLSATIRNAMQCARDWSRLC